MLPDHGMFLRTQVPSAGATPKALLAIADASADHVQPIDRSVADEWGRLPTA
jgi:hypothetical protein